MSANIKSVNDVSAVEAMFLDEHDSVFNPVHSKIIFNAAWMIIALVILASAVAVFAVAIPASALYVQSVPGASHVMTMLVVAAAAAFVVIVIAAGFAERHFAGYKLARLSAG